VHRRECVSASSACYNKKGDAGSCSDLPARLLRSDNSAADMGLCIFLGTEESNSLVFEKKLPVVLEQIQVAAFTSKVCPSISLKKWIGAADWI